MNNKIIDEEGIHKILNKAKNPDEKTITQILDKARMMQGLDLEEVGYLINLENKKYLDEMYEVASFIKNTIYGERLVFFAPLYISDFCLNDCEYCNFHRSNTGYERKKLTFDEIEQQAKYLIDMGHKRLLLEFGEDPVNNSIGFVVDTIKKIYSVHTPKGNIRRINVNIAATTKENYKKLKDAQIGTYQLFQETYHQPSYKKLHNGPKADYERQITAHNRAYEAGLDDLGIGVLFGLYDWRFEVMALISHAKYLEATLGVGPHTISIPRFQGGATINYKPEFPVKDEDFFKLIAILKLAVPYTGMIISTRENPEVRRRAFKIGVSQTSAGSVTSPGGYGKKITQPQFETHDQRTLSDIIDDILDEDLLPSFCTACYRLGRTGEVFMGFSKHGDIHNFCRPNGLLTFAEYLEDFANDEVYKKGMRVIDFYLNKIEDQKMKAKTIERLNNVKNGERDLYF